MGADRPRTAPMDSGRSEWAIRRPCAGGMEHAVQPPAKAPHPTSGLGRELDVRPLALQQLPIVVGLRHINEYEDMFALLLAHDIRRQPERESLRLPHRHKIEETEQTPLTARVEVSNHYVIGSRRRRGRSCQVPTHLVENGGEGGGARNMLSMQSSPHNGAKTPCLSLSWISLRGRPSPTPGRAEPRAERPRTCLRRHEE